jgi:hypothetical protein
MGEAAASRLRDQNQTIKSLDEKIAAIETPSLRQRCRSCQSVVLDCLEGISLAEAKLVSVFHRNGAGLKQAIDREIAAQTLLANQRGQYNLDDWTRGIVELDQASQLMIASSRYVLGVDSYRVDKASGTKITPDPDSIIQGGIQRARDAALFLREAQTDTARERELALLPPSLGGSKRGVRELLEIQEARGHVKGLGWKEGTSFLKAQVASALAAEPRDDTMLLKLESAGLPFLRELLNMGSRKLTAELVSASNTQAIRDGIVSDIITNAMRLVSTFEDLREMRVPPDLGIAAAIIDTLIDLWKRICSAGAIESMSDENFRALTGPATGMGIEKKLAALEWQVSPDWLVRSFLGPEASKALRSIPSMRGLGVIAEYPPREPRLPTSIGR